MPTALSGLDATLSISTIVSQRGRGTILRAHRRSRAGRARGGENEGIDSAHKKSVEQLALERLRSLVDTASSPSAVLRAVRKLPHPSASAVDDLDAAIAAARLPMNGQGGLVVVALD